MIVKLSVSLSFPQSLFHSVPNFSGAERGTVSMKKMLAAARNNLRKIALSRSLCQGQLILGFL